MWYNGTIPRENFTENDMKTKKILSTVVAVLGVAVLSGCGSSSKTVEFKNYWLKDSMAASVESYEETLVYDITFEKASGLDAMAYDLAYQNGSFTTNLKHYSDGKCEFTTKLTVDVVYTLDEGNSVTKEDSVETYVQFYRAQDGLTPIKSTKKIHTHSPKNVSKNATSVEDCYLEAWYSIETDYADGEGVCVKQDLTVPTDASLYPTSGETFTFSMGEKYSYLDNEQLLIGLRAISTSTSSATVKTYSPFTESVQKISVSFDSDEASGTFDVTENGVLNAKKPFTYRVAQTSIKVTNPGATQTAWFATEKSRNVMLRLETPLSFNLGTLVYSLKSIDRAE